MLRPGHGKGQIIKTIRQRILKRGKWILTDLEFIFIICVAQSVFLNTSGRKIKCWKSQKQIRFSYWFKVRHDVNKEIHSVTSWLLLRARFLLVTTKSEKLAGQKCKVLILHEHNRVWSKMDRVATLHFHHHHIFCKNPTEPISSLHFLSLPTLTRLKQPHQKHQVLWNSGTSLPGTKRFLWNHWCLRFQKSYDRKCCGYYSIYVLASSASHRLLY